MRTANPDRLARRYVTLPYWSREAHDLYAAIAAQVGDYRAVQIIERTRRAADNVHPANVARFAS